MVVSVGFGSTQCIPVKVLGLTDAWQQTSRMGLDGAQPLRDGGFRVGHHPPPRRAESRAAAYDRAASDPIREHKKRFGDPSERLRHVVYLNVSEWLALQELAMSAGWHPCRAVLSLRRLDV